MIESTLSTNTQIACADKKCLSLNVKDRVAGNLQCKKQCDEDNNCQSFEFCPDCVQNCCIFTCACTMFCDLETASLGWDTYGQSTIFF
jgi:hypothetical protein